MEVEAERSAPTRSMRSGKASASRKVGTTMDVEGTFTAHPMTEGGSTSHLLARFLAEHSALFAAFGQRSRAGESREPALAQAEHMQWLIREAAHDAIAEPDWDLAVRAVEVESGVLHFREQQKGLRRLEDDVIQGDGSWQGSTSRLHIRLPHDQLELARRERQHSPSC